MKRPNPSISKIAAAFGSRGRSPLYRWLWEHWSELPAEKPTSWEDLTAALNEAGIKGRDKQTLTADVVRKTYHRVAADKKRAPVVVAQVTTPRPVTSAYTPPSAYADPSPAMSATPRERKRMVLRSPVPLAEGEAAPDDGSRLPRPLRPETK